MTDAARLTVARLWSRRGSETVLAGIDVEFRAGEMVLLQGPNGSGKTTLFETIAGLLAPASGEVHLDGERVDGLAPERIAARGLVLVHQQRHLFGSLSVRDNVALADFARRPNAGIDAVEETLERFGLERFAQTPAGLLSGGEQRLVALARGLRSRPRVALLDEPLAALAVGLRERILVHLRRLADDGAAVVIVEHDAQRVQPYADRSLLLREGRLSAAALTGGLAHGH
jgi:ABC-type branched-subunit amino acid transport system ATPase component